MAFGGAGSLRGRAAWQWILGGLVVLSVTLLMVAIGLAFAPASWVDGFVSGATKGRFRIAEPSGNIWRGSGRLVITDGQQNRGNDRSQTSNSDRLLVGMALPGRLIWQVTPWPLFIGRLDAQLKFDSMKQVIRLKGHSRELIGTAGAMDLPQLRMDQLGSPWNTIQPSATLSVRWDEFRLNNGQFFGRGSISLAQVSSALSTVRPLGSYQVDFDSQGQKAQLTMKTVNGPLQLEGQGDWTPNGGLRFVAFGKATAEEAQLVPLLALLGKREGDRTVIRLGKQ